MNSRKVLIFGVFDGIHDGHLFLINEAKKHGDQLIAVVARDNIVQKLKDKLPKYNEVERIHALLDIPDIDRVLLGDLDMGTYNVLREVKPDIIFLGYDQKDLMDDINKKIKSQKLEKIKIIIGDSYKPEIFHSSILNE